MKSAASTKSGGTCSRGIFWPIILPEKVGTRLTINSAMATV